MAWLQKILHFLKSINYILVLAWVLPIGILLTILYLNFLPFGYEKTLTIHAGTEGDDKGEFYLEKNSILGARQSIDGKNFRYLDGLVYAVYKPKAVLQNATIEATVEGKGVSFILPPDLENVAWDYIWDAQTIARDFKTSSTIVIKDDCLYFDGNTRYELPNTADKFEDGPFAVYVEWIPEVATNSQQIVGHFNWEIAQNKDNISFQVGRMDTSTGPTFKISYPINESFFNQKHILLAIYNPIGENNTDGYAELFVDNIFTGKVIFGDRTILKNYGKSNLGIGWSTRNAHKNLFFKGSIYHIKLISTNLNSQLTNTWNFKFEEKNIKIPVWGTGELYKIKIKVTK